MFFGFGLPIFQEQHHAQQPNQSQGGFLDFLSSFMNPMTQQHPPEEQQPPEMRPTYRRSSGREAHNSPPHKDTKPNKPVYTTSSGIYWKQKGNECFRKKEYQAAIEHYTKAISLSEESIFYTNRARCYKILQEYERAIKDTQSAIELDEKNVKAHLISGQVLAEIGKKEVNNSKIEMAISRLKKALLICSSEKNSSYTNEINIYIYRAKKLLWYKKFNEIRERRINAITEYKVYLEKDQTLAPEDAQQKLKIFMEATNDQIKMQIPDYFMCKITYDLMEDPVTTEAGQTYERVAIQECIQRNGKTDPFSRAPITGTLYPNRALKNAIQEFIDNNPWAYEFRENEDYREISF